MSDGYQTLLAYVNAGQLSLGKASCASAARWCMKDSAGRIFLSWHADHRIRTDAGMPSAVIRLSTLHPIFASVR